MATVTHRIATAATTNGTSYVSGAFTPAADELLVVMVAASGTAAGPYTVTNSAGLTFTFVANAVKNGSADLLALFLADGPAAASSQTVTFNCTGDAATGAVIFVAGVSGMSRWGGAADLQLITKDNAAAATPFVTFGAACLTENPTIVFVANATNPAGLTPPTDWTENAAGDTGYNTPANGAEYAYRDSGFTSTVVTWGSASATAYGAVGVELDTSLRPYRNPMHQLLAH